MSMEQGDTLMLQKVQSCGLITFISPFPTWQESAANENVSYGIAQEIDDLLKEIRIEIAQTIFLHLGYCDFRAKRCKTPLRFSYSLKEKQIRVTYFLNYPIFKIADELDIDTFADFNKIARLDAIIAGLSKYKIPEENYRELLERRSKLGTIPEWIPEMEDNPQLVIDMYKASVPG
jgi:hypothetical protein